MVFSSSSRPATVAAWSLAACMQSVCVVSRAAWLSASAAEAEARSPWAVAFASVDSALEDFSSTMSWLSFFSWSSKLCFSISKLCLAFVSALRRLLSSSSAFSFRSSRTSRMLLECDLYTVAAGAPKRSSASSDELPCFAWTSAMSFCLSALLKAAASTRLLMAFTRLSTVETSICAKAAGFFAISLSITAMALPSVSMASSSSASLVENSPASFSRMTVASFRSAESFAMLAPSSSILASEPEMSLACLAIAASSLPFCVVAVLISNFLLRAASSHQLVNSM
mmetsp:Transcript_12928/g.34379  ORF Transcript_12928/g.34379 Transcript_12928/m.34379 type:complete len:283 (-) Transcript_12928:196-1044(-)